LEKLNSISDLNSTDIVEKITDAFINGATIGEVTKYLTSAHLENLTVAKLNTKRASEGFERLRKLSTDYKNKTGSLPKIFLANMGTVKEYKARADFSKGFFEVGGFEIVYPSGFLSIAEAVTEAIKSGSTIVVICSTDDKYPELVPGITQKLKSQNKNIQVILAGYPKEQIEIYKEAGVDDFIFLGADAMKILTSLHNKLGGNE
jgi:methylmalonyl-CoA mutase